MNKYLEKIAEDSFKDRAIHTLKNVGGAVAMGTLLRGGRGMAKHMHGRHNPDPHSYSHRYTLSDSLLNGVKEGGRFLKNSGNGIPLAVAAGGISASLTSPKKK